MGITEIDTGETTGDSDLFDLLGELSDATSLVTEVMRSLKEREILQNEYSALQVAEKKLSAVHKLLNNGPETVIYHFTNLRHLMRTVTYLQTVVSLFEKAIDLNKVSRR